MLTTYLARAAMATGALATLLSCGGCGGDDAPPALAESPHNLAGTIAGTTVADAAVPAATLPDPDASAVAETIALASAFTPLVPATINALPYWPVWYGTGKPVGGVNCLVNSTYHKHALISIYKDGKRLGFPDGIGRVHAGCYHAYEMHVHDVTGIIHREADVPKQFKLGQWFGLWKQPLARTGTAGLAGTARFYIIENAAIRRYDGDPALIDMLPHREVLIVTGTPMSVVPKYQWPAGI